MERRGETVREPTWSVMFYLDNTPALHLVDNPAVEDCSGIVLENGEGVLLGLPVSAWHGEEAANKAVERAWSLLESEGVEEVFFRKLIISYGEILIDCTDRLIELGQIRYDIQALPVVTVRNCKPQIV